MKTRTFYTGCGRITLNITLSNAIACSHPGQCDQDVERLSQKSYIKKQLDALQSDVLVEALKEYGAWDENELKDHDMNLQRILWIACCDIAEESKNPAPRHERKPSKKDRMHAAIQKHGENLKKIFSIDGEPGAICSRLRRIEIKANRAAADYCNGVISTEQWEAVKDRTGKKVLAIIGQKYADALIINGDPRGYTLKIDDKYVREHNLTIYRDMGGYGILAPDLTEGF